MDFFSIDFSLNILFFSSAIYCSAAKAIPPLMAVKNMSKLYFLFKSKIFPCLNWRSVWGLVFIPFFFVFDIPIENFHFCSDVFPTFHWVGKHKLLKRRDQQTEGSILDRFQTFLKTLSSPPHYEEVEKDHQNYKGHSYQHDCFFQQKKFLLESYR